MRYKLKDKILFNWTNEWRQIGNKYNWYNCTLVQVYFEKDMMTFGYELHFTLLGLGFYLRYNTDKALRKFARWDKEFDKLKSKLPKDNKKKLKAFEKLWKK